MNNMNGNELIAIERQRQINSEGWTQNHDDQHGSDVIERAAFSYRDATDESSELPAQWPWNRQWWKPKGRQRNLERAGALYLAAADVAERAGDYPRRDALLEHMNTCAILIDSIISK